LAFVSYRVGLFGIAFASVYASCSLAEGISGLQTFFSTLLLSVAGLSLRDQPGQSQQIVRAQLKTNSQSTFSVRAA